MHEVCDLLLKSTDNILVVKDLKRAVVRSDLELMTNHYTEIFCRATKAMENY
jgi:hypothetical protein